MSTKCQKTTATQESQTDTATHPQVDDSFIATVFPTAAAATAREPSGNETVEHETGAERSDSPFVSSASSATEGKKGSRQTVRRACEPCAKAKRRCDPVRPCRRCVEKKIVSQCTDRRTKAERRRELEAQSLSSGSWPPPLDTGKKRGGRSLVDDAIAAAELRDHLRKRQTMESTFTTQGMASSSAPEISPGPLEPPDIPVPPLEDVNLYRDDSFPPSTSAATDFLSLQALEQMGWGEDESAPDKNGTRRAE
eukprot:gb/GECG01016715.1/.p1 GENE.gb/GECG01016715.1/~~gb/GECG01016715.1/.p1  ORF type:complete len:252 (+),score=33.40 gb/GECG01016715.1/:1-756(+)